MSLGRHTDTIVAPVTAVGGAVAVVRVSGPSAWSVASRVFSPWPDEAEPFRAVYGSFANGDDGFMLPFAAGRSYTGEESVELSVHGSRASVSSIVELCILAGARLAEPGEFTLRAFMNGRIDLTQAEGVRDTVNAATEAQLRQANLLRDGALRDSVRSVRSRIEGLLASVEASTDFSEEVGPLERGGAAVLCAQIEDKIRRLLSTAVSARFVREGATVAIAGLPNAGKSSLLNAVLGSDRAIVTDVPGTTRDTVEERVEIEGALLRLVDTAGLRETTDVVERHGVERTKHALENADLVWYVYDAAVGWTDEDATLRRAILRPVLLIANKSDIGLADGGIAVSAKTGEGLGELLSLTVGSVVNPTCDGALVNERHAPLLHEALCALERVRETLANDVPDDLAAVDLHVAIRALGEITGETAAPDVIERIFHDFCIGK